MVEDYWSDFCTWKELTDYNEMALVRIFKKRLHCKGISKVMLNKF